MRFNGSMEFARMAKTAKSLSSSITSRRRDITNTPALEEESAKNTDIIRAVQYLKTPARKRPRTLIPILPLLSFEGKPYTLKNHFVMEQLFNLDIPKRTVLKCGRQVSKSTSLSAQNILQAATFPYFSIIITLPQSSQAKDFSRDRMLPFFTHSILTPFISDRKCVRNVLHQTFVNGASIRLNYTLGNVGRVRGKSSDKNVYDETQDLDWEELSIVRACMDASKYQIEQYAGTPKTLENTIQALWEDSSQAEWVIKCKACRHINIPSQEFHVLKMIGLKGVICAKCGKPLNPRTGSWWHKYPDRRRDFSGYHVPQIVMPMHYDDDEKWYELIRKRDGFQTSPAGFSNEVLGESCDMGVRLVTLTELKEASNLNFKNSYKEGISQLKNYTLRVMGVDWGGGGKDEVSFTTISVVGMLPNGKLEVIFMERLHAAIAYHEEESIILQYFKAFQCHYLAHDFGGSGDMKEYILINAGLPAKQVIPFLYTGSSNYFIKYSEPSDSSTRQYWSLNKTRSLLMTIGAIKTGFIRFPQFESCKDLLNDFLCLQEDKRTSPKGSDIYYVVKIPKKPDDIAHSVNFAACLIWYKNNNFPDIASATGIKLQKSEKSFAKTRSPKPSPLRKGKRHR